MKKINWKVRIRSGPFWLGALGAFLLFLKALLELFGLALPVAAESIMQVGQLLLIALATVGVISDPTTPGIHDSSRAMRYSVPGGTPSEKDLANTQ